jgi:hypothetical protein
MNAPQRIAGVVLFGTLVLITATPTRAISLDALFQGATITADDKLFDNFTAINASASNGGFVNTANIDVTPLVDDPLNPGIKFTAGFDDWGTPFGHAGNASVQLRFSFTVQTTTGQALIKDNSLLLNDFVFDSGPNASITISETITDAAGNALGDKMVRATNVDTPGSGAANLFDSADFDPQSLVHVEKFIDIQGPGGNDGVRLLMFEQRFSQIPEPATWLVAFGSGLLLAARRRR